MARFGNFLNRFERYSNQKTTSYSTSRTSAEPHTQTHSYERSHHRQGVTVSDDFCNSFWGQDGYGILFDKIKVSKKMLEELRSWYKERAALEADYAKRLQRLSQANVFHLMRYESHGLRNGLERIRDLTVRSAHSHAELSGTFKMALVAKLGEFIQKREGARKNPQASVEKLHKKMVELQMLQEKARKKFESDAVAVHGYSAQLHLVQGREMDKVASKLDKAQGSIGVSEKDYRLLTNALQDTAEEWNLTWKLFCDLIQDMEEDRIAFMRGSLWDFANGLSTIYFLEDEQCEGARKAIERCDATEDVKTFVHRAWTGQELYTAPQFVDYQQGEYEENRLMQRKRPRARLASFTRSSCRDSQPARLCSTSIIRELATAVVGGPTVNTSKEQPRAAPEPTQTVHQVREQNKRGGNIAEVVASNSFPASCSPAHTRVQLHYKASSDPPPVNNDPNHHGVFHGPGILVNKQSHELPAYIFDRPLPPHPQPYHQKY